jgi:hypothetical protein
MTCYGNVQNSFTHNRSDSNMYQQGMDRLVYSQYRIPTTQMRLKSLGWVKATKHKRIALDSIHIKYKQIYSDQKWHPRGCLGEGAGELQRKQSLGDDRHVLYFEYGSCSSGFHICQSWLNDKILNPKCSEIWKFWGLACTQKVSDFEPFLILD